jgi:hypothetical protein
MKEKPKIFYFAPFAQSFAFFAVKLFPSTPLFQPPSNRFFTRIPPFRSYNRCWPACRTLKLSFFYFTHFLMFTFINPNYATVQLLPALPGVTQIIE